MTTYRIRVYRHADPWDPRDDENIGTMACWHRRYTLGDEQPECSPEEHRRRLALKYDSSIPEDSELTQADERKWARQEVRNALGVLRRHGHSANDTARMREAWAEYRRCMSSKYRTPAARVALALAGHYVILPLYLYDHSGLTISTTPFSCQWDSGQVGFIYADKAKARETCGRDLSDDELAGILRDEVKTYDQYQTGDVWGFEIESARPYEKRYLDGGSDAGQDWVPYERVSGFYGSDPLKNNMLDNVPSWAKEALEAAAEDSETWVEFQHEETPEPQPA